MSNQCVFNSNMNLQSYQNPSFMFQSEPFKNCAISENLSKNNLPSAFANHTPTLLNDIEMLKYQFVNMSKRYEEQLGKYEELERKNEFLLTKYKELQFQFKLRELDMRTNLIETISNQIFNNKLESFLTELEVSNNKYDNKSKVVIVNPFVYGKSSSIENTNIINNLSQKKDEINTQDAGHVIKSSLKKFENKNLESENVGLDRKLNVEMNKAASVKKDKSESKSKFFGKESTNTVDDFPNSQLNEREKEEEEEEEVKINNREESVKSVNPEKVEKSSDFQKIKKKKTQTETLNTKENLDMPERKNTKRIEEKTLKKNSEILEEKKEIPKAKEKIPSESVKENKKNSRKNNNNNTKQSLKSKNKGKSYIEEEEDLVISDLDENRDHETQSIESIPSPVKATKNKKNNKKPTKQKKNTKKSNKTNSDTESDLDYSYESTYTNKRSKRNKNSTDYEEEIEEENSGNSFLEESKESSRDFKNVKKTKKKVAAAAAAAVKKTKKGKKTK
jgi:hypothetical protein